MHLYFLEQCSSIEQPTGGLLSYSTSGVITTVNFTCEKGYTLSGKTSLTCLTDGTWDQVTPTCGKLRCTKYMYVCSMAYTSVIFAHEQLCSEHSCISYLFPLQPLIKPYLATEKLEVFDQQLKIWVGT